VALLASMLSCGSDGGTSAASGGFALSLSQSILSVAQGASVATQVIVARTGFSGAVTLSVNNLPSGITVAFGTNPVTGNSATMTVTVAAGVAATAYTFMVRGNAPGLAERTAAVSLTVTLVVGNAYTITSTPATVALLQGGTAQSTIILGRSLGFNVAVTLSVTGAPAGVTATLNPATTSGNTSTLTVSAASSTVPGNYALTLRGTAAGTPDATAFVPLVVSASSGGTGNVTLDYSACTAGAKPLWLAIQNGTAAWSQVAGTGDIYRFTLSAPKGGIAWVTQSSATQIQLTVQFMTQSEMTAAPLTFCAAPGTRTVNGTVLGIGAGQVANISLGGASRTVGSGVPAFSLIGVQAGSQDLVAYRFAAGTQSADDRVILRRDQNVASGGSLAAVDFTSAEALAPSFVVASVSGAVGEQVTHYMQYLTGSGCVAAPMYSIAVSGSTATMYGIPAAQQRLNDFHMLTVIATTATTTRLVQETFHTLAGRLLALGSVLSNVTLTAPLGTYKRLQATTNLPSEYQSTASFTYTQSSGATVRAAVISATFGWRGGDAVALGVPDFAGVAGWNDQWAPLNGIVGNWTMQATGSNFTGSLCAEGTRFLAATAQGTF
jgi:hypothetical protein